MKSWLGSPQDAKKLETTFTAFVLNQSKLYDSFI